MKNYDVIIVGGGISGTMAAVGAARSGVKTLILEQNGFLGGMLTSAGVGPMMTFHAGEKQIVWGITGELINRLQVKGKSPGHIFDTTGYTYTVTPFDYEGMKVELESMLKEAGGDILYHTMLAGVKVEDGNIKSITICNKGGLTELKAKVFIDATGDADLSALCGVEYTKGRETDGACQPMTMKMRMYNVDIAKVKDYIRNNPEEFPGIKGETSIVDKSPRLSMGGFVNIFKRAMESGEITFKRDGILMFEGNTPGEVIINTTRLLGYDSTNPWSLSDAEIEGRRQTQELEKLLKKSVPGFENSYLAFTGPFIGVRSSRQIKGVHTLTAQDILDCRKFEDVIAHGGYPIDIHSPDGQGMKHMFLKWGEIYSIPYRCLVNDKINNMITVGRCISATFEAQAAIRVTPIAGAIGHAGGVGAAIAVKENAGTSNVNVKTLQKVLLDQDAYLEL